MKNRMLLAFGLSLPLTMFALMSLPMAPVHAISEVTPTPSPTPQVQATAIPQDVDVQALLEEAVSAVQAGDFETALPLFDDVLASEPDNVNARVGRAIAYGQLGRFDEALTDMARAIELEPWDESLFTIRASVYQSMGDRGNALLDYTQAITISPFDINAIAARAAIYAELGDTQSAQIDEAIVRGLRNLGNANPSGAIAAFEDATESGVESPAVALAHYISAELFRGNDPDRMLEAYNRAIELNPQMHIAYLARGILHRQSQNIEQAGADFAQRMDIHGRDVREQAVSIGQSVELEMAYQRVYRLTFAGRAGNTVTFTADDQPGSLVDPLIALLDPAGTPIAGDDDFGGNLNSEIAEFQLPVDGTYTLLVSHAEGGGATGFRGEIEVTITSNIDL